MAVFTTMRIDSTDIYMPNDFQLEREPIYSGEYTSMTGKTYADLVGWKYADTTLEWGMLPEDQLHFLIGLSGSHTLSFTDADGASVSADFVPTSQVATRSRETLENGDEIWHDISVTISFIGAAQ